jgi:hypothetical protein
LRKDALFAQEPEASTPPSDGAVPGGRLE